MNEPEIRDAFVLLHETCDPRGHELLAALENLLITETRILDNIVQATYEWRTARTLSADVVSLRSVKL
jgi:hypothetical protein